LQFAQNFHAGARIQLASPGVKKEMKGAVDAADSATKDQGKPRETGDFNSEMPPAA
jgi:hypothetical protein